MRKKLVRILAVVFAVLLTLTACNGGQAAAAIDDSVLVAWEGPFSKENRKSAIETYAKKYINVYAVNIEQSNVSVALEFEGAFNLYLSIKYLARGAPIRPANIRPRVEDAIPTLMALSIPKLSIVAP